MILFALSAWAAEPTLRLTEHHPVRYAVELTVDPSADAFSGRMDLDVSLDAPTTRLLLNAEALDVTGGTLTVDGVARPLRIRAHDAVTVELRWKGKVDGPATVHLDWTGTIVKDGPYGLFHARSADQDLLFTQFEADLARQAIPTFDQPEFKTPWDLTLRVPAGVGAFANSPVASRVTDGDHDVVTFATTPPLPTYLVAFAVGAFDVVDAGTAGRDAVPVRIVVPAGRGPDAAWAAETTGPILATLEDWFDAPYPFAKLDVVGIPNTVGFGAMEHPGLVTFDLTTLVAPAATDTVGRRRRFVEWQSHELAHQWFGNDVTMAWWDELWLNESFASWMGTKTMATLYPEWDVAFDQLGMREWALGSDAVTTARRIREPIATRDDIEAAFDGITYAKGQMVLDMFEAWVGADAFREGVRDYVRAHHYGTGTTAEFLAAIEARAGKPVTAPFEGFLDQVGAPRVRVDLDCATTPTVRLAQARFLAADPDAPGLWSVPVCVRYPTGDATTTSCTLLSEPTGAIALETSACPTWVVPNAAARGYYRPVVPPDALVALLDTEGALTPVERVATLGDAAALLQAGLVEPAVLLGRVDDILALDQAQATEAAVALAMGLDDHVVTDAMRPAWEGWIRDTFGPLAAELGFDAVAGESEETALLRPKVLRLVGWVDPALRAEARSRVTELLAGRGAAPEAISGAIELAVADGDAALFAEVRAAYDAGVTEEDRGRAIAGLASFTDPARVADAMALAVDGRLPLQERTTLAFGLFQDRRTRDAAWAIVKADPEGFASTIPGLYRKYAAYTGSFFCDAAHRAEVEATFARPSRRWLGGQRVLAEVLEGIDVCMASIEAQRPGVQAFLADR